MINGYVITLDTSQESIEASHKCIGSIRSTESEIRPHVLSATVPRQIKRHLEEIDMGGVVWTYPLTKEEDGLDIKTGLILETLSLLKKYLIVLPVRLSYETMV